MTWSWCRFRTLWRPFLAAAGHSDPDVGGGQDAGAQAMARPTLRLLLLLLPFAALASSSATGIVTLVYGRAYLPAAPAAVVVGFRGGGLRCDLHRHPHADGSRTTRPASRLHPAYCSRRPACLSDAHASPWLPWRGGRQDCLDRSQRHRPIDAGCLTSSIVYVVSSVWQTSGLLVVVELLLLSAGIVASLVLLGELTRRDIELATSLLLPPTEPPRVSERRTS